MCIGNIKYSHSYRNPIKEYQGIWTSQSSKSCLCIRPAFDCLYKITFTAESFFQILGIEKSQKNSRAWKIHLSKTATRIWLKIHGLLGFQEYANLLAPTGALMGRSPQICTVTNLWENFNFFPCWCLFICFWFTFVLHFKKKYISKLKKICSLFYLHFRMCNVRTW